MIIADINRVGCSQSVGCSILRKFDFCKVLSFCAHVLSQSLNGIRMYLWLDYWITTIIYPYYLVLICELSFSNLFHTVKLITQSSVNMPTTVSFQPKNEKEHRMLDHMILVISMLITRYKYPDILRHLSFFMIRCYVPFVLSKSQKSDSMPIDWHTTDVTAPGDPVLHSTFPSIPRTLIHSSIMSIYRVRDSLWSNDSPFSLFTLWAWTMTRWFS